MAYVSKDIREISICVKNKVGGKGDTTRASS